MKANGILKGISGFLILSVLAMFLSGCGGDLRTPESEKAERDYYKTKAGQKELQKEREMLAREEKEAKEKAEKEANKSLFEKFRIVNYEDVPEGEVVEIFKIGNDQEVFNGGKPASVKVEKDYHVTELWTYHWNGGTGAAAGTISLKGADGTVYGPWQAELYNGVYWIAKPSIVIPAGNYTVVDSDSSTWAQNSGSGGQGMTWMNGIEVSNIK